MTQASLPSIDPSAAPQSPFKVKISSLYEQEYEALPTSTSGSTSDTGTFDIGTLGSASFGAAPAGSALHKACDIPVGTVAGSSDANQSCKPDIPEGQNYLSYLFFEVSTPPGVCDIVYFYPYYYRVSNSATFVPEWSDDLSEFDCSDPDADLLECWDGAGVDTLDPRSANRIVYEPNGSSIQMHWTAKAARQAGRRTNLWTNNNLSEGSRANPNLNINFIPNLEALFPGPRDQGYIGGTMQDWKFECLDHYDDVQYAFTITINKDIGIAGSANGQSWPDFDK